MRRKLLFASVAALAMVPLVLLGQTQTKPKAELKAAAKAPPSSVAIMLEKGG